jgi:hypothetical protein
VPATPIAVLSAGAFLSLTSIIAFSSLDVHASIVGKRDRGIGRSAHFLPDGERTDGSRLKSLRRR